MSWGGANRPRISNRVENRPPNREGAEGDIQIKGTGLGAKLFAKWSGRWWDVPLSIDGITKIGTTDSDYLSIDRDSVDIFTNKVKVASFGETTTVKDINLTGKIVITSTEDSNVCIGTGNNDAGSSNVSVGVNAGGSITSAGQGIFIGRDAGIGVLSANRVIAIGYQAAGRTSTHEFRGTDCIAIGTEAMQAKASPTTMDQNLAIGNYAMEGVAHGISFCVCIGFEAGKAIGGNANICIGTQAGDRGITGEGNIIIGTDADVDADARAGCIIIGPISLNTASDNVVEIGNDTNSMTYDLNGGDITVTSDIRIKRDIENTKIGLEFINKLRPITYKSRPSSEYPEEFGVKRPTDEVTNRVWDGLIAQEVKAVMDELDVTFSGWEEGINTKQRLAYGKFVMPLIKSVQELSAKLDTMQTEINNLKQG